MQPYFIPYLGYIQLIYNVDKFVIYDDVNYIKRGWINRNNVLINNQKKMISLSLKKASINKKINEISICEGSAEAIRKTLLNYYSKSKYGVEVINKLFNDQIISNLNLAKFIEYQIRELNSFLNLKTEIINSSSLNIDESIRGQDRIIEICKILGASEYYNLPGGQSLYDKEDFEMHGIDLKFLSLPSFTYQQKSSEFVPYLSIVDVLSNVSPPEIISYLEKESF